MLINLSIILLAVPITLPTILTDFTYCSQNNAWFNAYGIRFFTLNMQSIAVLTNIFTKEQQSFDYGFKFYELILSKQVMQALLQYYKVNVIY